MTSTEEEEELDEVVEQYDNTWSWVRRKLFARLKTEVHDERNIVGKNLMKAR